MLPASQIDYVHSCQESMPRMDPWQDHPRHHNFDFKFKLHRIFQRTLKDLLQILIYHLPLLKSNKTDIQNCLIHNNKQGTHRNQEISARNQA